MNLFKRFFLVLSLALLTVGVLFFSALIVIRFYFAPRIDVWRTQFEVLAQEQLGVPVQFESLVCEFDGLMPIVRLKQIQSVGTNTKGIEYLQVESLSFGIQWWHVWAGISDSVSEVVLQNANFKWQSPKAFDELSHLEVKHMYFQYQKQNAQYAIVAEKLFLNSALVVKPDVSLSHIAAYGTWDDREKRLTVKQASIQDQKFSITFQGDWQQQAGKSVGISNFKGKLHYLELPELYTLLPTTLNPNAISWLSQAFIQGRVEDALFVLQGDLNAFPFGTSRESGYFEVYGKLKNILLNYHQIKQGKQWLPIKAENGEIAFIRDTIKVAMKKSQIWQLDKLISLSHVNAEVSDLERNTQLSLSMDADASASDWLRFIRATPLSRLSQDFFANSQAKGQWPVYLSLQLPINDVDEVKLRGSVKLNGSSLRIDEGWPWMDKLKGVLEFTQNDVKFNQIKGDFQGSSIDIQGSLLKGLAIRSDLKISSLQKYLPMPIWRRFSGMAAVNAKLTILKEGFDLEASSTLKGIQFDLPDHIRKTKNQEMPLKFSWRPQSAKGSRLSLRLANLLTLKLDRYVSKQGKAPYFYRGNLAVQTTPVAMPENGLRIDAKLEQITTQDWLDLVDEFQIQDRQAQEDRAVLPELNALSLQTDHLYYLRHDLGAQQVQAKRADQAWVFDLSGERATGRVSLHPQQLDVALDRLALYPMFSQSDDPSDLPNIQLSMIPAITGSVNHLFYQDNELGSLRLESERLPMSYYVKTLMISHPESRTELSGDFVQTGQGIDFSGIYRLDFEQLSYYEKWLKLSKPYVIGAKGYLSGKIQWKNILKLDLNQLLMSIEGDVRKGHFAHVSNLGLKFLNFIALQSITNLNNFKGSLKGAQTGEASFDQIVLKADIHNGALQVNSLLIASPVLTMYAKGDAQLLEKKLDFYTLVIPKIELSGAALATTAINPFVGGAALLSQWLFKDAISNSLSEYYHVTGTWDEPEIKKEKLPTMPTEKAQPDHKD